MIKIFVNFMIKIYVQFVEIRVEILFTESLQIRNLWLIRGNSC